MRKLNIAERMSEALRAAAEVAGIEYLMPRRKDFRRLSQYILGVNRQQEIGHILYEVSACLKDILDYELFGFAIKEADTLEVWIDPRVENTLLERLIKNEFRCQEIDNIHYFDEESPYEQRENKAFTVNNLLSYTVSEKHRARLYMMPKRKILAYHGEIIEAIVQTLGVALENCLNMKKLESQAAVDPLTDCYNRRALANHLDHDIAKVHRYGGDLSVVMFDIDHFKQVNDSYGHEAGDIALKEISRLVRSRIRKCDYLARYGGEEFVLVLPSTRLSYALELAERLRAALEASRITVGQKAIAVTASFGVAGLGPGVDRDALIREADRMVYKAKEEGRNRVMPEASLVASGQGFGAKGVSLSCEPSPYPSI
ncbi:MAG: hypothetical protein Kow0025_13600 [Thermodesulfovibrionales bacterium]